MVVCLVEKGVLVLQRSDQGLPIEGTVLLHDFFSVLAILTKWGSRDKRRVQDYLELQLSKREMVKRIEATTVPFKDFLWEHLLAVLGCKDPPAFGEFFFLSCLI